MAHTVILPPRCTAATLQLTHKGNINDKTIPERDGEVTDFNVTLLASAIARRRHLVIDTHRTDLGITRQGCHYIHDMIVTGNRTCVLFASEDIITQRIDAHLARAKRATVSVCKHLGDGRSETSCRKKPAKRPAGNESQTYAWKGPTENQEGRVRCICLAFAVGTLGCASSG